MNYDELYDYDHETARGKEENLKRLISKEVHRIICKSTYSVTNYILDCINLEN